MDLREDDTLIGVDLTDGEQDIMLFTNAGKALRFNESTVRAMGRTACGVRGIKLGEGQRVISLIVAKQHPANLSGQQPGFKPLPAQPGQL